MYVFNKFQIDIDFRVHYANSVNLFNDNFTEWSRSIISAARLSKKKDIVDLLREYDAEEHSGELKERDFMFSILALLKMLPSANTKHRAKQSSAELERNLIVFKPQQTSIDLFLVQKKDEGLKQPLLLCIGTRETSGNFYLILDCKAVELGNCGILRAVDCMFKSHFVFWVDYAKPLALFMEFLQKFLYKIYCNKTSARVGELANSIQSLMKCNGGETLQIA
jgi:hypothetical protein